MRVESDVEKQLASTHSISQKGMDQSSILECLQKKVSELLKYKEKSIAIETQLKIAQETLNLQAAEFAFEREEYENEIESLKKRSKMVPPEEAARRFDVEVRLKQAESKSEQFQSKYGKWKEKAKTLRQETRQLQLEIKKLSKAKLRLLDEYSNISDEELKAQVDAGHNLSFIGKVGQFTPIKPGCGGGILYRVNEGKNFAVTGTDGYRWLESEVVKELGKQNDIDKSYYHKLVDEARDAISAYGDFDWFVSDEPYTSKNSAVAIESDPLPFDLETIKQGEPLPFY